MISIQTSVGKICLFYWLVTGLASCGRQPEFMAEPPPAVELAKPNRTDVVKDSYIVMFRGQNTTESLHFASFLDEYQHHYMLLQDEIFSDPRVKNLDVLTAVDLGRRQSADWSAEFDAPSALRLFWDDRSEDPITGVMTRVDFDKGVAPEVLSEWEAKGMIWYAEPNGVSQLSVETVWDQYATNEKDLKLWWHDDIKLADAFTAISKVAGLRSDKDIAQSPPVIAVLDSGTDYTHESLKASIWENGSPGASGCDNDKYGCNTTAPSKGSLGNGDVWPVGTSGPGQALDKSQKGGHGTHVAGIIAAKSGNGIGGVCPVCKIMTVKVAESEDGSEKGDPKIRDDSQIRGLKYVTRFKKNNDSAVRVINSSFGKYSRSRSVAILVDALRKIGTGTLVIAAASNEDSMIRSYPAALNNAVAVAALREDGQKAKYSNFGPWVDIAAPGGAGQGDDGGQILSTWPGGQEESSGTSMASPVVAGVVGLYLAVYPNVDLATLRSKLIDSADGSIYSGTDAAAQFNAQYYFPKVAGEEARRPLLGSGILDAANFISGTRKNSVGRPLDRVSPGCATMGVSASAGSPLWMCLLLLPLTVWVFRRKF